MPTAACLAIVLASVTLKGPATPTGIAWAKDYKAAVRQAEAEQKPLMVMFTATW